MQRGHERKESATGDIVETRIEQEDNEEGERNGEERATERKNFDDGKDWKDH